MGSKVEFSVSTWRQPPPDFTSEARGALLGQIARDILTLGTGRLRVGVDGPTAAGKTTFGHELAARISASGRSVLRASLDDFKRPWKDRHLYDRESGEGYYRNAFDYDSVQSLLLEPFSHGSASVVLCSIDPLTQIDHSGTATLAGPDAVLIVDGVFAFRPELNPYWDYRIWLQSDEHEAAGRAVERDHHWAGADAEAIYRDRYTVAERRYLLEVEPLALVNIAVDNSDLNAPSLLDDAWR